MKRSEEAADGVRRVIEAAEALASQIEDEARERARQIEDEARERAEQIEREARERLGAEADQAQAAEERLARANQELERIQSVLADLRPASTGAPMPTPAAATAHEEPPQEPPGREATEETPAEAAYDGAPEDEADQPAAPVDEDPGEQGGGGGEGARLIALNMALTGTPREETARYLDENFEVEDPEALLDDVYERAGS